MGVSKIPASQGSAAASGLVPVSGEQTSIVDSVTILDSAEPGVTILPDVVPEPEEPEVSVPSDVVPEPEEPEVFVLPDVVSEPEEPEESVPSDIVPEPEEPEESVPADVVPEPEKSEVGVESDDVEDFFFDIHAPIRSTEDIFGPSDPEPESIFEVTLEKDISSFDLYADEQNTDPSPEKSSL